ncbi:MAG: hypothetical protein SGJ26_03225 [Nitrospirota bacterium]|nr:hypothetical protein [Nitrospirota bacterium]
MPIVINPANGAAKAKANTTFNWNMEVVQYVISKVIVGYSAGGDDIYAGGNRGNGFPAPTVQDTGVYHPGGNTLCYTRPKYKKTNLGTWYTVYSTITTFTSTP